MNNKGLIKKITAAAVILVSGIFLTGAGLLTVTLKNADKPFIDLGAEVGDSEIGHGGNADTGLDGSVSESIDGQTEVKIEIRIRDTSIFMNEMSVSGTINLKNRLRSDYEKGIQITLVDDYAESKTYTEVRRLLDEGKYEYSEKTE